MLVSEQNFYLTFSSCSHATVKISLFKLNVVKHTHRILLYVHNWTVSIIYILW